MPSRKQPVIIGVADVKNASKKVEDAIEPLELILQAIQKAIDDAGLSKSVASELLSSVDSLDVVRTWTWPYPDLSSLIAKRLAIKPTRRYYTEQHGGDQPAKLLDGAARRVSLGETKVAIVTGGEALASLSACAAAKKLPPPGWTKVTEEVNSVFSPTTRELKPNIGAKHSFGNPIQAYPMLENSFRAHRNQSWAENHAESAEMYAEFAQVAQQNPNAWFHGGPEQTAESIGTVSRQNRMICWPYPLLMNAFNTVNLAAACIITTTDYARELGVPSDRWIYPLGGAGTTDKDNLWDRAEFWWSPAISRSLDACIEASAVDKSDIDLYDFYSCFPIVPKLAAAHLGLPTTKGSKPITLLGGLTSFGGAGNNYSMHAITEMTRQLRARKGRIGLILANGGNATYQFAVCLSTSPRQDGLPYPTTAPLPPKITNVHVPKVVDQAEGDAIIETYTVQFNRDGTPQRGIIIGRLKENGSRFIANDADEATLTQLCSRDVEPIGRSGKVKVSDDGRNVFSLHGDQARL